MAKCWCGKNHNRLSDRGDKRDGVMKHSVLNWKMYELRMVDQGLNPFPEDGKRKSVPA
jgi:hypothetical protein